MRPDHSGVKIPVTDPEKNKELEKEFQQLLEETSVPPIPGLANPEPKKVPTTPVDSKKLPNPEAGRQRKQPPKTPPQFLQARMQWTNPQKSRQSFR
ncbi:MAG: hypothetical protein BRC57_09640 [Cyanobacteria bacterium QS_8_48_54]|nr:MAG: hypothetical protein BRC57_09640 [Cyanobacteria bacterium QS_8_48_54]